MTTETDPTTVDPPEAGTPYPRRWAAMIVLTLAFMLDLLNVSIVSVALPSIQRDLGATPTQVEWIAAAYLLAFAAALITFARLGDLWGRKRVFQLGVVAFAVTGVGSGLADTPGLLIAARAAQGLAAAALAPQVMSLLYTMFQGRERGTVFGVFGLVAGTAQAGGLLLGGVLLDADIAGTEWRMIFLITVPVAVVLAALAAWLVPESRVEGGARPRLLAAGVLTLGLVALVFPVLEGRAHGWPGWIWGCLVAGFALVVGLAFVEHRNPGTRAGALLPAELFRRRTVAGALAVQLLAFAALSGFLLVIVLWLQEGEAYSAMGAGVVSIALPAGGLVTAGFVGRLTARFGRLLVLTGCLVGAVGALGVLLAERSAEGDSIGGWSLVPGLFALGVGTTFVMPPLTTLFLSTVPAEHAGSASGVWTTSQQFGAAVGVAGLGTLYYGTTEAHGHATAIAACAFTVVAILVISAALCFTLGPNGRPAAPAGASRSSNHPPTRGDG
ncbi:MFS transporter [Streptomyces radicis]|uniref:MFS transporter n=1 Tax=Streptomyces radicis TaxID=1750517 RepID=A0A3A9WDZ8_9ACTN|nr:MFS transporter [Streptomyces radicis]RKN10990.1 MFS transporter [Streptomyces radicis]RKN25253.1 MFS transporter [Streptomyces radicis]